jgi:hypothetical protein
VSKRETGAERRARLDEIRQSQKAEQRKRTLLTAGIGLGAGVLIIGGAGAFIYFDQQNKPSNRSFSEFGVSASAAGCNDVETSPTSGGNEHVTEPVDYQTSPPSSGPHNPQWLGWPNGPSQQFYATDEAPAVENVVHNLEHGHNVVWYLPTLPQDQVDTLSDLAEKISDDTDTYKFLVVPWDTAKGDFPEGKNIGMSHWGAEEGSIQHCEAVSGEAISAFVDAHPITDAPEPTAP